MGAQSPLPHAYRCLCAGRTPTSGFDETFRASNSSGLFLVDVVGRRTESGLSMSFWGASREHRNRLAHATSGNTRCTFLGGDKREVDSPVGTVSGQSGGRMESLEVECFLVLEEGEMILVTWGRL